MFFAANPSIAVCHGGEGRDRVWNALMDWHSEWLNDQTSGWYASVLNQLAGHERSKYMCDQRAPRCHRKARRLTLRRVPVSRELLQRPGR